MNGMKNGLSKTLLFTSVLLITGVGFGAMLVLVLTPEQRDYLLDELRFFSVHEGAMGADVSLWTVLGDELRTLLLLWVLGLFCIGFPVILSLVFTKGLTVGFTVGFFVQQWPGKGMVLAGVSVLPHNLFFVPALVLAAAIGIRFSLILLGLLFRRDALKLRDEWGRYNGVMALVGAVFLVGSLVEVFVTVPMMDWVMATWY